MSDTLLGFSEVVLYGQVVRDLEFKPDAAALGGGHGGLVARQLARTADEAVPRLAKIYGFSFEGHYYDLGKPAIFLVHGDGTPIPADSEDREAKKTGFVGRDVPFGKDLLAWSYDKSDVSIRLDVETGTLEDILLESEVGDHGKAHTGATKIHMRARGGLED